VYALTCRYRGQRLHRSLKTYDAKRARQLQSTVELTLDKLEQGQLDVPDKLTRSQLWRILESGGRSVARPEVTGDVAIAEVCRRYEESYTIGSKDEATLRTERHHLNHFKRLLGSHRSLSEITTDDLRGYVAARQKEPGTHGRTIHAATIKKELQTFQQLWDFARGEGLVSGENPRHRVRTPRESQKPRFMTRQEIEKAIERGGLSKAEVAELWECMFLSEADIAEFLLHTRTAAAAHPRFRYIYAALAFCAYTGARRSEMFRCQIHDLQQSVQLREKKRSQRNAFTFRQVPLHPQLRKVLDDWLAEHPGGSYLFCKDNGKPLEDKTAREAFDAVTNKSKWSVLRGYHILRHSFASNLARHGVDQRTIDAFMGHQTEASRQRYRHLFPEDLRVAINVLNFEQVASNQKLRVVS
jgi:site-specific recombinase XerD